MKLTLQGHSDLYAVEQLMMQLFPEEAEGEAVSTLSAGTTYLTATAKITLHGRTGHGTKRLPMGKKDNVRLRRRILQQSFYLAAVEVLGFSPPWGALAGVRPTKLVSAHLLSGGTEQSADKLLKDTYFVSGARRRLCIDLPATPWRPPGSSGQRISRCTWAFPSAPPGAPTAPL